MVNELYQWMTWFQTHCVQYCPMAYDMWKCGQVRFPISATASDLALYMERKGLVAGKSSVTAQKVLDAEVSWAK